MGWQVETQPEAQIVIKSRQDEVQVSGNALWGSGDRQRVRRGAVREGDIDGKGRPRGQTLAIGYDPECSVGRQLNFEEESQMRNTNLLALAAALILACVWAWASSTGTKAAAPTGCPIDPFQAMVSPVRSIGTNSTIIDVSRYGAN